MDREMQTVVICETYGWTYQEFLAQPTFFIDLIREKMKIDAQKQERDLKKINSKKTR